MLRQLTLLILLLICCNGYAGNKGRALDSLNQIVKSSQSDTAVAHAYVELSEILYLNNLDTLIYLCRQAKSICERNLERDDLNEDETKSFKITLGSAYNNLGFGCSRKLDRDSALIYYEKAVMLHAKAYHVDGVAATLINISTVFSALNNYNRALSVLDSCERVVYACNLVSHMGALHNTQGYMYAWQSNHPMAIEKYEKALKFQHSIGNSSGEAAVLNNIARLNDINGEYEKAIILYRRALALHASIEDLDGMSIVANNIGHNMIKVGEEDSAMYYYRLSLDYAVRNDHKKQIAVSLENIGTRFFNLGLPDSCYSYYYRARQLKLESNNQRTIGYNSKNFAELYINVNKLDSAFYYATDALDRAEKANSRALEKYALSSLVDIHSRRKEYKLALNYQLRYTELYDSLQKLENQKAVLRNQFKTEYEQKMETDKLEKENLLVTNDLIRSENEVQAEKLNNLRLWLTVILLIMVLGGSILRARLKRQALRMQSLESDIKLRVNEIMQLQSELKQLGANPVETINESLHTPLTEREEEILSLICEGLTNKEIADKIFLSVNTIKTHIQSLYVKLDVTNRTQAAIKGSTLKNGVNS